MSEKDDEEGQDLRKMLSLEILSSRAEGLRRNGCHCSSAQHWGAAREAQDHWNISGCSWLWVHSLSYNHLGVLLISLKTAINLAV